MCLAISLGAPSAAESKRAGGSCARGAQGDGRSVAKRMRLTTFCLLNQRRRNHGLPRLRIDPRLRLAARRHARDMVVRRYFAHVSIAGHSPWERIRAAGYIRPGQRWLIGENLAWGAGRTSRPADRVRALMHSPPHRAVILNRSFREVGLWVARRTPVPTAVAPGATYVLDFGRAG